MVQKTSLLFLVLCYFFCGLSNAQVPGFERIWGGSGTDAAYAVKQASDSAVFVLGSTDPGPFGYADMAFTKMDPRGNLLWTKYFAERGSDHGLAFCPSGNGWLLAGVTTDTVLNAPSAVLLIRVDSSGTELWRMTHGAATNLHVKSIAAHPSGGFYCAGFCNDAGGNIDAFILHVDSAGNKISDLCYGTSQLDLVDGIGVLSDGRIACGGTTNSVRGEYDLEVALLDTGLNMLWDSVSMQPFTNGAQGMMVTTNDHIITFGETEIFANSAFDFRLEARDSMGNLLWIHDYGGAGREALFGLTEAPDGDLVGTGYTNTPIGTGAPADLAIIRMDSSGNLRWIQHFGGPQFDMGYSVCPALGGGFFVAGFTTQSDQQFYLLRVNELGLTSLQEENGVKQAVYIGLDPLHRETRVHAPEAIKMVEIFGLTGQLISRIDGLNQKSILLNDNNLTPGYYLLKVQLADGHSTGLKWLVEP